MEGASKNKKKRDRVDSGGQYGRWKLRVMSACLHKGIGNFNRLRLRREYFILATGKSARKKKRFRPVFIKLPLSAHILTSSGQKHSSGMSDTERKAVSHNLVIKAEILKPIVEIKIWTQRVAGLITLSPPLPQKTNR